MSIKPPPDAARQRRNKERIQRQLDEALEDSFPASDPVSIVTSHGEEDWGEEADEPEGTPAPPATGPSTPGSNRPG
jgi:2-methylcitrate dehydratase PrpD